MNVCVFDPGHGEGPFCCIVDSCDYRGALVCGLADLPVDPGRFLVGLLDSDKNQRPPAEHGPVPSRDLLHATGPAGGR